MTNKTIVNKELTDRERLNEASIILCRAIAINDLIFENVAMTKENPISAHTLAGVSDALNVMLNEAKDFVDSINLNEVERA